MSSVDFSRLPPGPDPRLEPAVAAALLVTDLLIGHEQQSVVVTRALLEQLRLISPMSPPAERRLDEAVVSVSHPVVMDGYDFIAGVLFRRSHFVLPTTYGGLADFGREEANEETVWVAEQPFEGATAELMFSPPRQQARYLLEFWCRGRSIQVDGSDGTSLQSDGSFSVVLFSWSGNDVTYTMRSSEFWSFQACSIRWLPD